MFAFLRYRSKSLSHEAEILDTSDLVVISTHRLIDVVGVGGVASHTLLRSASLSLIDELLANTNVFLHHLNGEDVVDLNVMSGETVVEEAGREHHTVASIPELRLILLVEVHDISGADESESAEDHVGGDEPDEEAGVVKRSVVMSNET